jgi:hypothetical protein
MQQVPTMQQLHALGLIGERGAGRELSELVAQRRQRSPGIPTRTGQLRARQRAIDAPAARP